MKWSIYVDLARPLTVDERSAVFAALQELVPDAGCVGLQNGPSDEVYFRVDAPSAIEARNAASAYVEALLNRAQLSIEFEIHVQPE
jgi:hypothetical protein